MLRMGRSSKNEAPPHGAHEQAPHPHAATSAQHSSGAQAATSARETVAAPQQGAARSAPAAFASLAEQQPGATSRAVTESEALARAVKDGGVGGFVGGASALVGEINFRGMMRVDGRLSGRVRSDDGTLIVSAGGHVEAEVEVAVAKINGTVEGDVVASVRVELGRTARVSGNVQTPALVVEEGAIFEGQCRMKSAAAPSVRARHAA